MDSGCSNVTPEAISSEVIQRLLAQPNSSLLRYSCVFAEPRIGRHGGSSTFPIRSKASITCFCFQRSCSL